jgi:ferrous iron transport protein B
MGFGCNACGVVGCRIIDSPRERLIAILTNAFVPCNGRFPTLIALITLFFAGASGIGSLLGAAMLTGWILLGIAATLLASRLLSATLLKGVPSSFQLELPPYRKPQIGKIILHSLRDRTLFVLGRAAATAAPAGMILWLLANVQINSISLLAHAAHFLEPAAKIIGMDGTILLAFLLALPANEILIPAILMGYLSTNSLTDFSSLTQLHTIFLSNHWTQLTALCVMLFTMMHWPCATTLWTIRKETGGWKWAAWAALLPTAFGLTLCAAITGIRSIFG